MEIDESLSFSARDSRIDPYSAIHRLENFIHDLAKRCGIREPEQWPSDATEHIVAIYNSAAESDMCIPELSSLWIEGEDHNSTEARAVKATVCLIFICSEQAQTSEPILEAIARIILDILYYTSIPSEDEAESMANILRKVRFLLEPQHLIKTVPNGHEDQHSENLKAIASAHWDLVVAIANAMVKQMVKLHNNVENAHYDGAKLTCTGKNGQKKERKLYIDPDLAGVNGPEHNFTASEMKDNYVHKAVDLAAAAGHLDEVTDQGGQPIEAAPGQQRSGHTTLRPTQADPQRPTRRTETDIAQPLDHPALDDHRRDDLTSDDRGNSAAEPPEGRPYPADADRLSRKQSGPDYPDRRAGDADSDPNWTLQNSDRFIEGRDRNSRLSRRPQSHRVCVLAIVLLLIGVLILIGVQTLS